MRDYRKSDYAINKYSPNIVYRFHDEIIEVSLEDYLKENPDKTEQDFAELKAALRQPVLFDLRNVYRKADAEAAGLEYHGTGVAPTQRSAGA